MDGSLPDLLFWSALAIGAVAVAWQAATDRGGAALKRRQALERRLARYPASARPVVIQAQPRRALMRALPGLLLAIVAALSMSHLRRSGLGQLCDHLGAAQAAQWTLLMIFPGLPALLTPLACLGVARSIRILRGGYAPPLNAVLFHDTVAVAGWRARWQASSTLVFLVLASGAFARVTYDVRRSLDEVQFHAGFAARCTAGASGTP